MITGAKVKTDRRDAFTFARLLRVGALPEAYIYPKDRRAIRDLLRRRDRLVGLRATTYGGLQRILYQHGIYSFSREAIKRVTEEDLLVWFDHPAIHASLRIELERIRMYTREINSVERYILSTVSDNPLFSLLQTIPGVGKILALVIFYEVGDIGRFGSVKQFCSYARVVPGIAQSGLVS